MKQLNIKNKKVGTVQSTFIIAEVAQAHDGSLGTAHAFIDAVAEAGVDAIKFQTHIASAESTYAEPWRVKFSKQDVTRFDYWQRMEFTKEQWQGLYDHSVERGIAFLSSPFSVEAVDLLEEIGIGVWKVASGEVGNVILLNRIIETKLPVLLSSGMSSIKEIDTAVTLLQDNAIPFGVFQCSSYYPCPPEKIGLNMLEFFQKRYDCPVGLSDHSGTIYPSLSAVCFGAKFLEMHVTFSKQMFGPDVPSSVTIDELNILVEGVRFSEKMVSNPVDKEKLAEELEPMRDLFTKSIVAAVDLSKGTVLQQSNLTVKKPGIGIPADKMMDLLGCRMKNDVSKDTILEEKDIEWESK